MTNVVMSSEGFGNGLLAMDARQTNDTYGKVSPASKPPHI